jgi:signal transduction histidine kinase
VTLFGRFRREAYVDETRAVIAETEETKAQLRRLTEQLSEYVTDLRALTRAKRTQEEGTAG